MKENVNEDESEQVQKKEGDKASQMVTGDDESTKEGGTVRTAVQKKRADNKEREKEKKRKEAAKAKEKKATVIDQLTATSNTEETVENPPTDIGEDKKVTEVFKDAANGIFVVKLSPGINCLNLYTCFTL